MLRHKQGWAARTQRVSHDGDREAQLIAAAARVFARLGFSDTRVADIATEAGLSRSGFYVYFESKAAILRAVGQQVRDEFIASQSVELDGLAAREVLRRTILTYLDVSAQYSQLLGVLEQQARSDEEIAALVQEIRTRPTSRSRRFIERAAADDGFKLVATSAFVANALTRVVEYGGELIAADPARREDVASDVVAIGLRLTGADT